MCKKRYENRSLKGGMRNTLQETHGNLRRGGGEHKDVEQSRSIYLDLVFFFHSVSRLRNLIVQPMSPRECEPTYRAAEAALAEGPGILTINASIIFLSS